MKVFIAGPRKVSRLNKEITERLQNIRANGFTVLVGDANGVDKAVQKDCSDNLYDSVTVYAVNGKPRNNLGNWEIKAVEVKGQKKDFSYYTAKDKEMARDADYGFMIWNGESKGTLNNIINLTEMNKKVLIYFLPEKIFYNIDSQEQFHVILQKCDAKTSDLFRELLNNYKDENNFYQSSLNFK